MTMTEIGAQFCEQSLVFCTYIISMSTEIYLPRHFDDLICIYVCLAFLSIGNTVHQIDVFPSSQQRDDQDNDSSIKSFGSISRRLI